MTETLAWNFVGNDEITDLLQKMDRVASRLDRVIDHLGDTTRGAGRQFAAAERHVDKLGDEMAQAGRQADDLGDGMAKAGRQATTLAGEIEAAQQRIRDLGDEFGRTGDGDLFDRVLNERAALAKLQRVKRALAEVADEVADAGKLATRSFSDALGALPSELKGALIIGAVGAASAAAPLIGSAIVGAIGTAVGGGAIAAGIAGAAQDPAVKRAWQRVAQEASGVFTEFSTPFIGPTIEALEFLRANLKDLRGDLDGLGAEAADLLEPLTRGLVGLVREALPGIRNVIQQAEPLFDMLEDELPRIGAALESFFDSMADGSEGGADGLRTLLRIAEGTLVVVGEQLEFVADRWRDVAIAVRAAGDLAGPIAALFGEETTVRAFRLGETGTQSFDAIEDAAEKARVELQKLNDAFGDAFGKVMDLDEAQINFKLGMIELKETIKENGRTLDATKEAGLRNRDALLDQIDKAKQMRDAELARSDGTRASTDKINAAYDAQLAQIRALALALKLPQAEVDAIINKYKALALVPDLVKKVTFKFLADNSGWVPPHLKSGQKVAYSSGGPIGGSGPRGIDSQAILAAPGEYVLTERMKNQLGGEAFLERLRAGVGGAPAVSGGAPAGGAGVGGDIVVINKIYAPDGRLLTESQRRYARQAGIRTIEELLDMPAV